MNIYDYSTWKFSLTRWGVTDFGMTTTFLSMWNLIRTWGYGSNEQWSFSSVLFNFPMIQIFFNKPSNPPHDSIDFLLADVSNLTFEMLHCITVSTQFLVFHGRQHVANN